ncbi:PriCT-2 domain-containing protein [Pseudoalteromonas sp. T1lg22]|uniref:PriCT-2 domain-containing protein n=1 Tax=Pseudoalteromonas sp. T1lg22 TaxID=2077096 RepID=UPI000CF66995|nr:PriCT-2 domain-containing protein [Pseudoalteromonas sp. T1lg22]
MQHATMQDLQSALQYLDPNCPRDEWVKVAMGIKDEFGDAGFNEFDSWSSSGEQYKPSEAKSTWRSIKAGGGITIATVFKMATDNGYKPQRESVDPAEQARLKQEFAQRAKEREAQAATEAAERQQWHGAIANFATSILEQFTIQIKSNKYLATKKVDAFGVYGIKTAFIAVVRPNFVTEVITGGSEIKRFFDTLPEGDSRDFSFLHIKRGDLVIPLIDIEKKVWNIQVINASGTKLFLKHGRKSGLFHFIGKANSHNVLAVCEGYATGASIHMATGWPCAVALDAGNLLPVAKELQQKLSDKSFIFCADNDVQTKGNPGVTKAKEAAAAVNGLVAVPDFSGILNKEAA